MAYVPVDEFWKIYSNKFFAIVLASREARRLAKEVREQRIQLKRKPTIIAIKRVAKGEVEYTYTSRTVKTLSDLSLEDENNTGDNE